MDLEEDEDNQYILALKQEFVGTLRKSRYFLKMDEKKQDIARYSDKYQLNQQDSSEAFVPGKLFESENRVRAKIFRGYHFLQSKL